MVQKYNIVAYKTMVFMLYFIYKQMQILFTKSWRLCTKIHTYLYMLMDRYHSMDLNTEERTHTLP